MPPDFISSLPSSRPFPFVEEVSARSFDYHRLGVFGGMHRELTLGLERLGLFRLSLESIGANLSHIYSSMVCLIRSFGLVDEGAPQGYKTRASILKIASQSQ